MDVNATIRDVLDQLEGTHKSTDSLQSAELHYAAWRKLCQQAATEPVTASTVITTILLLRPKMPFHARKQQHAANQLLAELVLALSSSTLISVASTTPLYPVLSAHVTAHISSSKPALVDQGMQVLNALITSSAAFCQYVAGHDGVVSALGNAMRNIRAQSHESKSPWATVATACEGNMEHLLTTPAATAAFLQALSRLISGDSSAATGAAMVRTTIMSVRVYICYLLEALLCARPATCMHAAGVAAMNGNPQLVQDVLGLLVELQAGHAAQVLEASTGAAAGQPAQAATAPQASTPAAVAAPGAAGPSGTSATAAVPCALPTGASLCTASGAAPKPHPALSPALRAQAEKVSQAITAAVAACRVARQVQAAQSASALADTATSAATPATNQLSGAGADSPQARQVRLAHPPISFAAHPAGTTPATASKADPVPHPASAAPAAAANAAPAQKPDVSLGLLQRYLRMLESITQQQPCIVAGQMVTNPKCLQVLVQLLQPSTKCSYQAANIITSCICCEDLPGRDAVGFIDLFSGTPGALAAIAGVLEGYKPPRPMYADEAWDMQKQKAQSPSPPGSFSIKLNFTKLIQGLTAVLKLDTPSTKTPGANNIAGSVNVSSVAATMGSPAPGGLAAWLTAKPSFIPSLQFLVNRSSAGLLVPLLDLLYPFCRPAQQRGFVQQAAPDGTFKKGKKQLVNHLAELLEYPSISNDEALQQPAAAHMLLQIVNTHPQHALKASYHKKPPGPMSPVRLGSPSPASPQPAEKPSGSPASRSIADPADGVKPSDGINSIVSGLLAAVQIRHASSSTAAARMEVAGYAAEALVVLAGNPVCSEYLSHPAAVERLMELVAAAGQPSSWECLQDSTLSSQYRQVLLKMPYVMLYLALLRPSVPRILEQHPGAVSTLAAALVSNQSNTADVLRQPKSISLQQAQALLLERWPALRQVTEAATHQQDEQQSEPSPVEGQQESQQEPASPQRQHRLAAVPEDVSLCEWSPVRPGCPADREDLQDTAGSQHREDPISAVPSQGDGLAADAVVFVVPGSSSRLASAGKGLDFWGSGVKQYSQAAPAEGSELLLEAEQQVGEQPNQGLQLLPLLSGYTLRQQQHAESNRGPSNGAAQLRDMSVHTPFFGGFMLSPQPQPQVGLDWCASGPAAAAAAPAPTPATATAVVSAQGRSGAAVAAAAPSVRTTTHGTVASGRGNGRHAGLHVGLAAMLTPSMFASAMEIELPGTADEDMPTGESAVQPAAAAAECNVPLVSAAFAAAPAPMCVDTANQDLQGNRASSTSGQNAVPAVHANLVTMLSPAAGPVLAQGSAPAAAAGSVLGSASPPTVSLPPVVAANPGIAPAVTTAAASSPLKRRHYRNSKHQQGSACDPSAPDSELPPSKVARPSTDATGSSGMQSALLPPPPQQQQQAVASLQQPQQHHPAAQEQPNAAVPQQQSMQPQQQEQQQPGPQSAEEDELTEIQGGSDDSSDESDSGSSPVSGGSSPAASGCTKKEHREPYQQVWLASQAPKVQELMTALGFGSSGDTPSGAKAMLRESIEDGAIVYTPHRNLKKLPAAQRQAAKSGRFVVAAHMKRSDKKHIGAVWGYGWGPDRASAEVMAAEAAVANMYVSGVGFKQLPPYDGPGPK